MKLRYCGVLLLTAISFPALALTPLSEQDLASTVGQDGLTLSITPAGNGAKGKINVSSIVYTDTDGFSTPQVNGVTYNAAGSLFTNMNANSGILLCTNQVSSCTLSQNAITMDVDVDGSASALARPMMLATINLPADVTRIRFDVATLGIGIGNTASTHTIATFSDGINLDLASQLKLTVALGGEGSSTNTNALINIVSGNFSSINFGTVSLNSVGGQANESSVQLGVRLQNIDFSGADINVTSAGLIFTKSSLTIGSVLLSDITAGSTSATPSSTSFNGTGVGSLGTIGMNNVVVTNPQMIVKGL